MFFLPFFQTATNMPFKEVKIKCQISLSARHQAHVQFKCFADDDVKQFTNIDITYHTRMIYKPIHIKTSFGYLF